MRPCSSSITELEGCPWSKRGVSSGSLPKQICLRRSWSAWVWAARRRSEAGSKRGEGDGNMGATVICPNCGCSFTLSREDVIRLKVTSLARAVYPKDLHGYHELLDEADVEHYEIRCACS